MRIVSFSEAGNGLKTVLDNVINDADCTIISRRDAPAAVIMSMDSYNSLMETVLLLKSPANVAICGNPSSSTEKGAWSRDRTDE